MIGTVTVPLANKANNGTSVDFNWENAPVRSDKEHSAAAKEKNYAQASVADRRRAKLTSKVTSEVASIFGTGLVGASSSPQAEDKDGVASEAATSKKSDTGDGLAAAVVALMIPRRGARNYGTTKMVAAKQADLKEVAAQLFESGYRPYKSSSHGDDDTNHLPIQTSGCRAVRSEGDYSDEEDNCLLPGGSAAAQTEETTKLDEASAAAFLLVTSHSNRTESARLANEMIDEEDCHSFARGSDEEDGESFIDDSVSEDDTCGAVVTADLKNDHMGGKHHSLAKPTFRKSTSLNRSGHSMDDWGGKKSPRISHSKSAAVTRCGFPRRSESLDINMERRKSLLQGERLVLADHTMDEDDDGSFAGESLSDDDNTCNAVVTEPARPHSDGLKNDTNKGQQLLTHPRLRKCNGLNRSGHGSDRKSPCWSRSLPRKSKSLNNRERSQSPIIERSNGAKGKPRRPTRSVSHPMAIQTKSKSELLGHSSISQPMARQEICTSSRSRKPTSCKVVPPRTSSSRSRNSSSPPRGHSASPPRNSRQPNTVRRSHLGEDTGRRSGMGCSVSSHHSPRSMLHPVVTDPAAPLTSQSEHTTKPSAVCTRNGEDRYANILRGQSLRMVAAAQQARDNLPDDDTTVATEAASSIGMPEQSIQANPGPTRRETLSKFYKGEIDLSDQDKKKLALNPSRKHEASSRTA